MQVAVGLGREAGADFGGVGLALLVVGGITGATAPAALAIGLLFQVALYHLAQEITGFQGFFVSRGIHIGSF
jgi:hypothetical protein